jgi:hypothetical protein
MTIQVAVEHVITYCSTIHCQPPGSQCNKNPSKLPQSGLPWAVQEEESLFSTLLVRQEAIADKLESQAMLWAWFVSVFVSVPCSKDLSIFHVAISTQNIQTLS